MTDTIRPKIDAIAPALLGAGGRTLSDIYDALSAIANALDGRLGSIEYALYNQLDGTSLMETLGPKLNQFGAQLDALSAALGANPYNNLELGSVRGFLNNANSTLSTISQSIGATVPNEPYLAVRPYLSQIAQSANATAVAAQAGNSLLSNIDVRLGDVNVNLLSGNSLLGDVNVNLSDGGDLVAAIYSNEATIAATSGIITQTILDTSGSIRLDLVAVQDAVAGGASATVGEIITQMTALSAQTTAQTTALETALSAQTTAQTTALGVQTAAQTTALEGAINANGNMLEATLTSTQSVLLSHGQALNGIQSNTFDALGLLQQLLDSTVEPPPP